MAKKKEPTPAPTAAQVNAHKGITPSILPNLLKPAAAPSVPPLLKPIVKAAPLPGDKGFIGPVTGTQTQEGKVRALAASANAPGLTSSQKADRARTLGRAQAQLAIYKKNHPEDQVKYVPPKVTPKKVEKTAPKKNNNGPKNNNKNTNNNNNNKNNNGPKVDGNTTILDGGDTPYDPSKDTGKTELFPTPYSAFQVPKNDGSIVPDVAKPAGPELLMVSDENYTPEYLEKILFENLSGIEIISIARHDEVDGADLSYSQISNLGKVSTIYGGANLMLLQNTSEQIARRFPVNIDDYIPTDTSDPDGLNRPVYFDASGNIVIEIKNAVYNEQVDVQILQASNGTIY
jgi:hypothetical protein